MPKTTPVYVGAVRVPTRQTLQRYGLTAPEWRATLDRQGGTCVCGNVPKSGTLHIDHEHRRGYKDLPPEERKGYVRGLLCWFCNSVLLRRGATPERLRAAANYLERYERAKTI